MANMSLAQANKVLKEWYLAGVPKDLAFVDRPLFGLLEKELVGGKYVPVPLTYSSPQGTSSQFSIAQAYQTPSQFAAWNMTMRTKYSLATVDAQAIAASSSDRGAFVKLGKFEIDKAMKGHSNQIHTELFQDGSGIMGTVAAINANTVTLSVPTDALRFENGMNIQFVALAAGGTPVVTVFTVLGINRGLGQLTLSAAPSAPIAAGYFICRAGDYGNCLQGLKAWIPFIAPVAGDNFNGQDRSLDVERLAGNRIDGTGGNIQEVLIELEAAINQLGGNANVAILHPRKHAELAKQLSTQVRYEEVDLEGEANITYKGFRMPTSTGSIAIVADRKQDLNLVHMLQLDTWKLLSNREIGHMFDYDGVGSVLRVGNADAVEARINSYLNLVCTAPAYNGVAKLG